MKIPNNLIPFVYKTCQQVYRNEITKKEGKALIVGDNRMNPNSATHYIDNFKYMLQGQRFIMTLNYFSVDYFLENILKDYGRNGLLNSLNSLRLHVKYYEKKQNITMLKMRELLFRYNLIESNSEDINLQNEIINGLENSGISRSELIRDLKSYEPSNESKKYLNKIQIRKRDNSIIAKLKIIRDFKCQICSSRIQKANGLYYIEAAHIIPKRDNGNETPKNILILCPNHHKEFDYGKLFIESHTKEKIEFILNDKNYIISLALD